MSKKLFFFGVAALLSVSLFMLGCPTGSVGRGVEPVPTPAQLAAALAEALNKTDKGSAAANNATVTLQKPLVALSADITVPTGVTLVVPASTKLTVNAGKTLTVANGGQITLTGGNTATAANLILAAKVDQTANKKGGGKLRLVGVSGGSVISAPIQVADNAAATVLTATATSAKEFTFGGNAGTIGEPNLDRTTAKKFNSIEAATIRSGRNGTVTFKAGNNNATINKETTLKSR
jgi:hypothetical protein